MFAPRLARKAILILHPARSRDRRGAIPATTRICNAGKFSQGP